MSLTATGIGLSFGGVKALDGVGFRAEPGRVLSIIGPNGAGKTTLFNIISGLYRPERGRVTLAGEDVTALPPHVLARKGLSRTFQNLQIFSRMTAAENVMVGRHLREPHGLVPDLLHLPAVARRNRETREKALELLHFAGLGAEADVIAGNLPYGALKRLEIARALAVEPKVLLLDEPFGALDAKVRAELREWLRRLHDDVHVTTVLVTHDQEEAMAISDRIAVMDDGRIEQVGGPRELYDQPATRFVMSFLGPVSQVGGELVRPHDIAILLEPADGARQATVARVVHLGFEVRVQLTLDGGETVFAQVSRGEADALELVEGAVVWVRTTDRPAVPA